MNLTRDAAIELSASLWREVAETGKLKSRILYEWYFDPMLHDCPCCEYVSQEYPRMYVGYPELQCQKVCPLCSLWPSGCAREGELYMQYVRLEHDPEAQLKVANEIATRAAKLAKLI
ncbi:MAG TPA: hypothetical protein VMW50_03515 [Dehalococcoidia bacterium]|nr:hypothetical protein [Dehalococcoidia bacterium]